MIPRHEENSAKLGELLSQKCKAAILVGSDVSNVAEQREIGCFRYNLEDIVSSWRLEMQIREDLDCHNESGDKEAAVDDKGYAG